MDIAGTFFREVLALLGYGLVFAAVYKLFQMSSELTEIKELLKRNQALSSIPIATPTVSIPLPTQPHPADFGALSDAEGESATAYAEQLMRALHSDAARQGAPTAQTHDLR